MVIIMIINFAAARIELPVVFNNSSARACDRDPGARAPPTDPELRSLW